MSVDTMRYGSWNSYGDPPRRSVEATVLYFISTRESGWCRRVEQTGAFVQMVADYREAINKALPEHVSLVGDDFRGPRYPADYTWTDANFSITAIVRAVDLDKIIEANDPDL